MGTYNDGVTYGNKVIVLYPLHITCHFEVDRQNGRSDPKDSASLCKGHHG